MGGARLDPRRPDFLIRERLGWAPLPPGPRLRERPRSEAPKIDVKYGRYESTDAEVAVTDTDADILRCSGTPDSVRLTARTNGALFTLTNLDQSEDHTVAVLPNTSATVHVGRRLVRVRNLVAGSAAAAFVEAYYAQPGEAFDGFRP